MDGIFIDEELGGRTYKFSPDRTCDTLRFVSCMELEGIGRLESARIMG